MSALRSYGNPCGIARALDLVGERWALLVVRELLFGPKRFSDLRAALPGLSANVLSQRLRELEAAGVVRRRAQGAPTYELSDWGRELGPLLVQLGRWGAQSPLRPQGELSVDALMVALESTFLGSRARERASTTARAAAELRVLYELQLGEERFSVTLERGNISIARGSPRNPDAVIETDAKTLRAVVFGDRKLGEAQVKLRGDLRLARSFFRLFARPQRRAAD